MPRPEDVEVTQADTIETFRVDPALEQGQCERLARLRTRRDAARAALMLEKIETAARGSENLMPIFIEAAKARVTLGEICGVLRKCWGVHNPTQAY